MKYLSFYIQERLHITKDTGNNSYNYHPKTKDELKELVNKLIEERGDNADLNDIDTSEIKDMSELFMCSNFTGDISKWNVSNVENMNNMFEYSKFNGDISNWNISNVKDMKYIFYKSTLEKNPPKWYKK